MGRRAEEYVVGFWRRGGLAADAHFFIFSFKPFEHRKLHASMEGASDNGLSEVPPPSSPPLPHLVPTAHSLQSNPKNTKGLAVEQRRGLVGR